MISGALIDAIIMIYTGYATIIGFSRGLFNVLVGVFGVYGALFFSWVFQAQLFNWAVMHLGVSKTLNPAIGFVCVWVFFYGVIRMLAKVLTTAFKLSGINFVLRISGAALNALKAIIFVTVVITFLTHVNDAVIESTALTTRLTLVGSKFMRVLNKNLDEGQIQRQIQPDISTESVIIDDDFKYNLLKR